MEMIDIKNKKLRDDEFYKSVKKFLLPGKPVKK